MAVRDYYVDNVLRERYDDDASPRVYTSWDASGVQTSSRPYTAAENAYADSLAAAAAADANGATLRTRAANALTANSAFLAIASPTNAQAVTQVQRLTRECSALIRLSLDLLDSIADT